MSSLEAKHESEKGICEAKGSRNFKLEFNQELDLNNFRIIRSQEDCIECLQSLKVLFRLLDENTKYIIEALDILFKGGEPEIFHFLNQDESKIVDFSDSILTLQFKVGEEVKRGQIYLSQIESYSDKIVNYVNEELIKRRN